MSKNIGKRIAWFLIACAALYGATYFWGTHSEGFQFAEQKIRTSHLVVSKVGSINQIELDPSGGYRERFVNSEKYVHMLITVTGEKRSICIDISAKKQNGVWKIESASADGQPIDLD